VWFKLCVKNLSIQPSEAWKLDFVEMYYLFDQEKNNTDDMSVMLNFEREINGASKEWLLKN
jgi:hypothetical protein